MAKEKNNQSQRFYVAVPKDGFERINDKLGVVTTYRLFNARPPFNQFVIQNPHLAVHAFKLTLPKSHYQHNLTNGVYNPLKVTPQSRLDIGFVRAFHNSRDGLARKYQVGEQKNILINGIKYELLDSTTEKLDYSKRYVSIGATLGGREIISVKINDLIACYARYVRYVIQQKINGNDFFAVLKSIEQFVREKVFPSGDTQQSLAKIEDIVSNSKGYVKVTDVDTQKTYATKIVSLQTFIDNKLGCCRHRALVMKFLVECMLNLGHAYIFRGEVNMLTKQKNGSVCVIKAAHAWIVYLPANNKDIYIVDNAIPFVGQLSDLRKAQYHFFGSVNLQRIQTQYRDMRHASDKHISSQEDSLDTFTQEMDCSSLEVEEESFVSKPFTKSSDTYLLPKFTLRRNNLVQSK